MITVENLSFTYRKSKRVVLHDFSLAFESGRGIWIAGEEWCRKVHSPLSDVRSADS